MAMSVAVQVPVGGRVHGHGEHARHGRADDGEPGAVGEAAHERVAPREPDERAVGGAQARLRGARAAVGDELRRGAQDLDELGGQLAAGRGLAPSAAAAEPARERRDGDPARRAGRRRARARRRAGRPRRRPTTTAPASSATSGGPTARRCRFCSASTSATMRASRSPCR